MTAYDIDHRRMRIDQASWSEGWRKTPLWLRLLGAPKTHYDDRGSYRMKWGELSLSPCSVGVSLGGYETAHLNIAIGFGQVFIHLKPLDRWMTEGPNQIESPHYGFSIHADSAHLNWGRKCRIVNFPWRRRYLFREFLDEFGNWRSVDERARSYEPGIGVEPYAVEHPYHYMLSDGEVQHVTATVTRERYWKTSIWFGESTHPRALGRVRKPRKAWISDGLRQLQKRHSRPVDLIEVAFSAEVGGRAGSWKGGALGCGYEMKTGENPRQTLQRMQEERRFR